MNNELINEIKKQMNEATEFAKSILLIESLLDVRNKNASDLSDDEFLNLIKHDPKLTDIEVINDETLSSKPESYSRWLLKMSKKGELKNVSHSHMQQLLKSFEQAKNRRNLLPNNDINSYKSVSELESAVETAKGSMTANQKNKDAKRNQKQLVGEKKPGMYMNGAVELLFNGKEWEVWTPHTYEGSKALRRGAVWCTGGDTDHHYKNYTKNGKLFVIINKEHNDEKYQLFVPEYSGSLQREFRDKHNDQPITFREFVHENKELLDFFMTQEIVTDNYAYLEDPDVNDEWTEDKEYEVMNEYNLGYDDYTGEVCMYIDYYELLNESYYTSSDMYADFASNGYLDNYSDDYSNDVISSKHFVDYIDWHDTQLKVLHTAYQARTKKTVDFNTFLYTLFRTEGGNLGDDDVHNWLVDMGGDKYQYHVREKISRYALQTNVEDFIYNALRNLGINFNDRSYNGNNYKDSFPYRFDDCHSVQQFYEDIADNGEQSAADVMAKYDIYIEESKGEIDPETESFERYEGDRLHEDDAKEIFDMFLTISDYNKYVDYEEGQVDDDESDNESTDNDEEINEVLKIAGVK
jgi:hypothetical protein